MPIYLFHRKTGYESLNFYITTEKEIIEQAASDPTILKIEFAPTGRIVWEREPTKPELKFKIGDRVRKVKGSQWQGTIVGTYSTELTPEGYVIESDSHAGSCQIYPAAALEKI